jgi:protein required for attachment to host cells
MSKIWVVAADSSRARFFTADKPAGGLNEVETLSNPEGRLHEGDLVSDRGGRGINGAPHSYNNGGQAKDEAANRFAAEVCGHLERGRNSQAISKLYVMAPPHFLGLLRKHQSGALRGLITNEVATDLTTQPPERIRAQLPEYL